MFEVNKRLRLLSEKIKEGKPVIGCFVLLNDPSISEIVGMAGCDFVWIDAEHGMLGRAEIKHHIVYAQSTGACAFVRVPGVDPDQIKCILDCGPDAIIFPNIANRKMAEEAVAACTYPSEGGVRGVGPGRIIDYGIYSEAEYLKKGKDYIWKIFQIESIEGVQNMEEIAKVSGIHSLFIGPADLGMSMRAAGVLDEEIDERVEAAQLRCGEIAKKNSIYAGSCAGPTKESCQILMDRGIQWMTIAQDLRLLSCGLGDAVRKIRS
ncbi:MAG TPA: host specificity protein [Candidatus Pelethocola excrementipullorum]|nr:host specificity protein [Candidatus Pelethocola excrementipullorum]